MAKQLVFIVTTDKDGDAVYLARCTQRGGLDGLVKSISYIPDNRIPFDETVNFEFSGAPSGDIGEVEVLKVEKVSGRQTWDIDGPELKNQSFKVVVTNGGKGKCGSFVVTCS